MNIKTLKLVVVSLAVLFVPLLVFGQGVYQPAPLQPAPTNVVSGQGDPITLQDIINTVGSVAQFMLFVGALIAIIFIVYGGIKYMSAGSNSSAAADARQTILNGLIGAIIVMGVGVLLATAQYIFNGITRGFL
ncbi:MAG: hypothetical protein Q8Q06_04490 [bacterium]|nr:hypothetical protein [bacterium]